jgi:hypothetical protein
MKMVIISLSRVLKSFGRGMMEKWSDGVLEFWKNTSIFQPNAVFIILAPGAVRL